MTKNIKYTSEFKREAVKLAQSSDKPTIVTAKKMGINSKTLYNWISQSMKKTTNKASNKVTTTNSKYHYQEPELENKRLKKELKRAEMEREILKKATAYFAILEL
jgi:transposase